MFDYRQTKIFEILNIINWKKTTIEHNEIRYIQTAFHNGQQKEQERIGR